MNAGIFFFIGWFIRVVWDILDRSMPFNYHTSEGKKNLKFALLSLIISGFFFFIQWKLDFEDNFDNDWARGGLYLLFTFAGYFPTHVFKKLMDSTSKKVEQKFTEYNLTVTEEKPVTTNETLKTD